WGNRSGGAQVATPSQNDAGQRWRNRVSGANTGASSAGRTARMADIQRQREAGNQARPTQRQWQGRNRTYSDPDRNRTYRRDGQRTENWRNGNRRNDRERWSGRNENWRNDPGRWNND